MPLSIKSTLSCLFFCFFSIPDKCHGQNDLNKALQIVLSEMNEDDFFWDTWLVYRNTLPLPVTNDCEVGEIVPLSEADSSLTSVLERGTLRMGVHMLAASVPFLYSTADGPDQLSKDLTKGDLDGYEVACAKEATRRLGLMYNVTLEHEFVLSTEDEFFDPLVAMLNNDEVDVTSAMNYVEERADFLDFTCNNFSTEVVIVGSGKVGGERPDPNGPRIPLVCNGSFCTVTGVPLPFELYVLDPHGGIPQMLGTLVNTTDPWEYALCTYDLLEDFFTNECPECVEVDVDPVGMLVRKTATKLTVSNKTSTDSQEQAAKSAATGTFTIKENQQVINLISNMLSFAIIYQFL